MSYKPSLLLVILFCITFATLTFADGTETLGPATIGIAPGTDFIVSGVGLALGQPGDIEFTIPTGSSIKQVILYWSGFYVYPPLDPNSMTITVADNSVQGKLIGGPAYFFGRAWTAVYRADITSLNLVTTGQNSIQISNLAFDRINHGAGILVICDDQTSDLCDFQLRDGADNAFRDFEAPKNTCVTQDYYFAPADKPRTASLGIFAASITGNDLPGLRPNVIEVAFDNNTPTAYIDHLNSVNGNEWDSLKLPIEIPANASSMNVTVKSEDFDLTGELPASLVWIGSALCITPIEGEKEGCTPGYWKQKHHFKSWVCFKTTDKFDTVFGVKLFGSKVTLLQALSQGGGGKYALGRHSVAALLNALNDDVNYYYSVEEVVALVQKACKYKNYEQIKDLLEAENESLCLLN